MFTDVGFAHLKLQHTRSACKPDNARTKSALNVLIFNLSKDLSQNVENVYDTRIKQVSLSLKVP